MIKIDGSYGEGGGQIVRTALALSTILGKPFEIGMIRQGRAQPGLKAQHLTCLHALEQLCGAKFSDAQAGSTSLRYIPGEVKSKKVEVDIGTAGSITLLMQSLLLPCFLAPHPVTIRLKGGTSGLGQMPFDYFSSVLIPQLRKYGEIKTSLAKRGYYPKGNGCAEIRIKPKYSAESSGSAPMINLPGQGKIICVQGVSHASMNLQHSRVAERQADSAKATIADIGCAVSIRTEYCETASPGSGITLWAVFSREAEPDELNPVIIGADSLGEIGKPSEQVGKEAGMALLKEISSRAPVDSHLADNLIPFLAVFGGSMKVAEITSHTRTNIYASERFLGKIFEIDEKEKIISCSRGISAVRQEMQASGLP